MSRNGMEVLAPAGGWEALEAAVRAGADAVYLGGQAFGARANAKNFTREELAQAVEYCHQRGVRVHVTVNTLLKNTELAPVLEFVEYLCSLPVDAVLVQDIGLLALLRERAPKLPLHASTQMSLHSPAGVRLAEELGFARVVLARELTLEEIAAIRAGTTVELEAFVHGALCMSVSGQCLLSAVLGGRSGNRGQCAQPCRLAFAAPGGTGHDLSLKDLSFVQGLPRLQAAGVCSAKIEGRMKRPEYVAAATAACRLAADGEAVPPALMEKLEGVFSRSGFTDGYLTGHRGREMFGTRRKEDVTAATGRLFGELRGLYRTERQSVPVTMALTLEEGQVVLTVQDRQGHRASVREKTGQGASLTSERATVQLKKTGGTVFAVEEVRMGPQGVPLSVGELNGLRRQALSALLALRGKREAVPFTAVPIQPQQARVCTGEPLLRTCFRDADQVPPQATLCKEWVLPLETPVQDLEALRRRGPKILLDLPRGLFGGEELLRSRMAERMEAGFRDFLCGNLGAFQLCRELGGKAHGSFGLNITNTAALEEFARLGLLSAEVSPELSGREIGGLGGSLPRGVAIYGRQALMLTRNCPLANSRADLPGCLGCKAPGFLTDRKGVRFPVQCRERGRWGTELLNSVPLWLGDMEDGLQGVDFAVARFSVENSVECGEIITALSRGLPARGTYTRGLFRRGVE